MGDISISNYIGSLMYSQHGSTYHLCGASLLSRTKALTAAHCLKRPVTYYLTMGVTDLENFNSPALQTSQVSRIDIHPGYIDGDVRDDIAVLTLKTPMNLTPNVNVIKLSRPYDHYLGRGCQVNGWGATEWGTTRVLQNARFSVSPLWSCRIFWFSLTGRRDLVNYRDICARSWSKAVCFGDSGGPLTCNKRLSGVLSWGATDCNTGYPGVFTRVRSYKDWIYEIMGN